jgi:cell division protease FtsH
LLKNYLYGRILIRKMEEKRLKNNKARGWIVFVMSLLAIILLFYLTQTGNIGTKISISGPSTVTNSLQSLIGVKKDSDGKYIVSNEVNYKGSSIQYVALADNGIGYVIAKDSKCSKDDIVGNCDYYFEYVTESDYDEVKAMIEAYNTEAESNGNGWVLIEAYPTHVSKTTWWESLLPYLSVIIVVILGVILIRSILGANQKSFNFGKTKAQIAHNVKVKFSDVAGIDEEKEELLEIVEFLKNPQKFTELGAKIPKGILLVGQPGTGKTLLAKAIAGESNVPFFSISGSDFVEMFVGVGASRVRDLFDQAKKESPCIVFIDEIDAVGRQRGAGLGGGNDEREQTLNQLLVQMDGFEGNTGIIVIAATNRADVLDPALLRPGRFDRQIYIMPPDVKGREMILKIHARNKPIDSAVDFKNVARLTSGFTGADLENLLNEAAILTARENRKAITMTDITEGINKVIMGPQKRSRVVTQVDKRITAYHESGHAIVGKVLEHCDVVQEVSIIARGMAAGYTISRPDNDESHMSYNKLIDNITMMLGGRAAEEIMVKDISTGASNDIERATKLARKMVTEWGMSAKLGTMNLGSSSEVFLGRDYQTQVNYSEKTASEIDSEVKSILDNCYSRAKDIITKHAKQMNTMVEVLLEKETIYFNEVEMIMKGKTTKQILLQMEQDAIRNKERIEIERAQADLERVKKEQSIRIKTAEALKKGGVLSAEEIEKVKTDSENIISVAEKKVQELKDKFSAQQEKHEHSHKRTTKTQEKGEEVASKPKKTVRKIVDKTTLEQKEEEKTDKSSEEKSGEDKN